MARAAAATRSAMPLWALLRIVRARGRRRSLRRLERSTWRPVRRQARVLRRRLEHCAPKTGLVFGALVCQYTSSSCCFSSPIYLGGNKCPALRRRIRGTARRSDTDLQHKGGRRLRPQTSILQLQLSAVHRRDCITSAAYSNKRRAKRDKRCV